MKLLILIFLALIHISYEANILGLMNIASPSHSIWNNVLIDGLAEKGHNVTVIISDLPKNSKNIHNNISYFAVTEVYAGIHEAIEIKDLFNIPAYKMIFEFCTYCTANCDATLKSNGFQNFMKTYDRNFKFDVILYDYTCGPCLLGLLEYFNYPPLIGISAFPFPSFGNRFTGGDFHPGYITFHSAIFNPIDNYFDRLHNHFLFLMEFLYKKNIFYPDLNDMVRKKHFPMSKKSIGDLEKYITVSLVNSHSSITPAESIPPNLIEVGGLQLIDPEPLPKDLENFILSAKKGCIFFSMGTNVRPEDISDENIEMFVLVMKKFSEYNFMWKFDATKIKSEIPKNVLIKHFFPQRDILAHSRTQAFITHSGGLSTQESIWYSVPMLGLPLFCDQLRNIQDAVEKGIAVHVDFTTLTAHSFEMGLKEILENKKYKKNIELLSKTFHDRPSKPLDTAIWWIEYILRHPNPDHLKPKSLKMNYFAANSLDFIIPLIVAIQIILFIILGLIWFCCCKNTKEINQNQKKFKVK